MGVIGAQSSAFPHEQTPSRIFLVMVIKGEEGSQAVQILSPSKNGFQLDEEALRDILLQPSIAGKKCAVISVAGAFRKGKSFLLNFFINYLETLEKKSSSKEWCSVDSVLDKFHWRSGSEADTHGIHIWSHPFILKDSDEEDVAVFLMDTQGTFDSRSTVKQCATIFALSTMLSSLQIYNLSMNLQEDDLQHLSLFTEYGKLAGDYGDKHPFQQLMFLIRDWANSDEHFYGFNGGQDFLEEKLTIESSQPKELKELRKEIRKSFQSLECFLMPHPGLKVANNNKSNELGEVEPEFLEHMAVLVPSIFEKSTLVAKIVAGQKITCRQLMQYFKSYTNIFNGETLPEPKSLLLATAEVININALSEGKVIYQQIVDMAIYTDPPLANARKLALIHEQAKADAIKAFDGVRKFGGDKLKNKYRQDLEDFIESYYSNIKQVVDANEKLEQRKLEQELRAKKREAEIKAERERIEQQKRDNERRQREEQERIQAERERFERERREQQRLNEQRQARLRAEQEELERQRREEEHRARARREEEARIQAERQRLEQQRIEQERRQREEQERMDAERESLARERRQKSMMVHSIPSFYSPSYAPSPSFSPGPSGPSVDSDRFWFDTRMGSTGRWRDRENHNRMCKNPYQ